MYTYTDDDVVKLHDQCARFCPELEFVVYADENYDVPGRIERLEAPGSYASGVECYREAGPMMVFGLDTVIRRDLSFLSFDKFRTPKSRGDRRPNNGVALVPAGHTVWQDWRGGSSDMLHVRQYVEETLPHSTAASYKWDKWQAEDAAIVYFHGNPKPRDVNWLQ